MNQEKKNIPKNSPQKRRKKRKRGRPKKIENDQEDFPLDQPKKEISKFAPISSYDRAEQARNLIFLPASLDKKNGRVLFIASSEEDKLDGEEYNLQ